MPAKPLIAALSAIILVASASAVAAKTCVELRALCWTMRDDKNDCTGPYRRCLQSGVFVTPLGRVFKATR